MSTPPTVGALAKLLGVTARQRGQAASESMPLEAPQPLDVAGEGSLTWLSAKQLAKREAGPTAACVVVAPEGAAVKFSASPAVWLEVPQPKLGFTRAVAAFFEALTRTEFSQGQLSAAVIAPTAVLGPGVVIGPRVHIGAHAWVGPNTVLANCTVGERSVLGANCSVGLAGFGYERDEAGQYHRFPHVGDVRIGRDVEIGSNTCIDRGSLGSTVIGDGCKIDNLVHIAHNVVLGRDVVVIANSMVGGSVQVRDGAWLAPSTSVLNQLVIGDGAVLGLGAVVLKSVAPRAVMVGNPAKYLKDVTGGTP